MKIANNKNRPVFRLGAKSSQQTKYGHITFKKIGPHHLANYLQNSTSSDVSILDDANTVDELLKQIQWKHQPNHGFALVTTDLNPNQQDAIRKCYGHVAISGPTGAVLSEPELAETLSADNRGELAIAGYVISDSRIVVIWRGDFTSLVVPFDAFKGSNSQVEPDFSRFAIIDYGQTLQFGDYQAAMDALLYEYDPAYRKRLLARRRAEEKGLGPSIRRLRKQRRLKQHDFSPISPKTIARIEKGEVADPRADTLNRIARRLDVTAEELTQY